MFVISGNSSEFIVILFMSPAGYLKLDFVTVWQFTRLTHSLIFYFIFIFVFVFVFIQLKYIYV